MLLRNVGFYGTRHYLFFLKGRILGAVQPLARLDYYSTNSLLCWVHVNLPSAQRKG
jgi:hypothetical protein